MPVLTTDFLKHSWEVFLLFLIPIGSGIPGGVVLAKKYDIAWSWVSFLYLISDFVLALVFEPLMLWFIRASEKSAKLSQFRQALSQSTQKILARYGKNPGPFQLVMITFGTDPMTGRSISKTLGHGFFSGWAIAITGDMMFFFLLMASTLLLNDVLGDGTIAAIIVTAAVLVVPGLIEKYRGRHSAKPATKP